MKRSWQLAASMALASGLVVALHAQAPASTQSKPATPEKITLTGCVERADQVTPTGTAATTVDSLSFVLINAAKGSAADAKPETRGTSGTASASEKGSMYRLDADLAKLNPHVGHKVELTGTLDTAGSPTAANPAPPSAANAPTLKVDTVKMLAETCAR
jgi:hypothetical protein